jgi:uncharacterized protein (DUF58 family)
MAAWFLRRQGADALPVTLRRRRIYILPTRAGLGFGLLMFFMLAAGLNYGNSLALLVTFELAGVALVAMHLCHRNLLDVVVAEASAGAAFAGEPGLIHVLLANESTLPRHGLGADVLESPASLADLPRGARQRLALTVPTERRGVLRIERLRVTTTHPFGLFRAWSWVHTPIELTVYPRPAGGRAMPLQGGPAGGRAGAGGSDEDEWLGLRAFREGDSPRQVAWKAYARGAPLLVKEYVASGSQLRIFDFSELSGLDTEARLAQLARWIVDAEARGEPYGVALPEIRFEPDHGPQHRHACLAALARFGSASAA